ncbi:MAG: MlaE family lipid ABC transporter permease subunit [Alphaproteobacteria bacterium]|nr:MlaE family lipid ABC transporter permease subunit [Alphaproteobacteria bacterium]
MNAATAPAAPSATLDTAPTGPRLVAAGPWTVNHAGRLDRTLDGLVGRLVADGRAVVVALDRLTALDTAGAWLLHRTQRRLAEQGVSCRLEGLSPPRARLVAKIESACAQASLPPAPRTNWLVEQLAVCGRATLDALDEVVELLAFFGALAATLVATLVRPWRLRATAFSAHVMRTGLEALPIVGLMSFLIGVVLAFQGASQLRQFGAELFTIDLLALSILREIGVLMTAIIVAGRSGSAFTAQIGTMVVNEEVDALRTLGLDPMEVLVVPRVLALMVSLPLLAVFADFMGLLGGGLLTILVLDLPLGQVVDQLQRSTDGTQFWAGLVKAPVFAFVIAMVGCRNGLRVEGDAASVGRLTTQAVVSGIFLVILLDAGFSIAFNALGI